MAEQLVDRSRGGRLRRAAPSMHVACAGCDLSLHGSGDAHGHGHVHALSHLRHCQFYLNESFMVQAQACAVYAGIQQAHVNRRGTLRAVCGHEEHS